MLEVEWMSERDVGMMINHKYAFDIMVECGLLCIKMQVDVDLGVFSNSPYFNDQKPLK